MAKKSWMDGYTEEQLARIKELEGKKVPLGGYISLIVTLVIFSGVMTRIDVGIPWLNGILQIFDLSNLLGRAGLNLRGTGGFGAYDGFQMAISVWPAIGVALGLINIVEGQGGLLAAQKIFNPLLRPAMGIPGWTGIALVTNTMGNSDAAAALTRTLIDDGLISEKEVGIFTCYQFICPNPIGAIVTGAVLYMSYLNEAGIPLVYLLVLAIISKVIGANFMRLFVHFIDRGEKAKGGKA